MGQAVQKEQEYFRLTDKEGTSNDTIDYLKQQSEKAKPAAAAAPADGHKH